MDEIIRLAAAPGCGGEATRIMRYMLEGRGTDHTNAEILRAISSRDITDDELYQMLYGMREFMTRAKSPEGAIDVCGTGGDGLRTFNISTAAAFVAAAGGACVAKHGNRSSSGGWGSADIFEGLGIDIDGCSVECMMQTHRICFMFAPRYHTAVRNVAGARRMLGGRTIFNILGPLCNPAGVLRQMVGVSDMGMVERMPRILVRGGATHVMCVVSQEGADELLAVSANRVCTYVDGAYRTETIRPEDVGARPTQMSDILLGDRNPYDMFVQAVCGVASVGIIHTVAMNAGAALVVAGLADDLDGGFEDALNVIESGRAQRLLYGFAQEYGDVSFGCALRQR